MPTDTINWRCRWNVRKYTAEDTLRVATLLGHEPSGDELRMYGSTPFEDVDIENNLLTTAGLNRIGNLVIASGSPQALVNTSARIGTGDGSGTAAVTDTDLSAAAGSTHRFFQPMDATFPSQSNGVFTLQSTFTSANGNFAWNEFGIDIGTPTVTGGSTVNALLLNHKTSIAQGTKSAGQTWVATATITLS